jgi:hypothetical protein
MEAPQYLDRITIELSDNQVKDIVQEAFGTSWGTLNELQVWTHYDNAFSRREQLSFDRQLSNWPKPRQAYLPPNQSPRSSSMRSTPSVASSPASSPAITLDEDFCPAFDHAIEFSKFVVAQAKYFLHSKQQMCPPSIKPPIPVSLAYNEVIDANFIADIAVKAMSNPGEFY